MTEARIARQNGAHAVTEFIDTRGVALKTTSSISEYPAIDKLSRRLNGDTQRGIRLFRARAEELDRTGQVSQAQILKHIDSTVPPIYGVQTGDPNPNRRIRVFFSRDGDTYDLKAMCKADEDRKALDALINLGYRDTRQHQIRSSRA